MKIDRFALLLSIFLGACAHAPQTPQVMAPVAPPQATPAKTPPHATLHKSSLGFSMVIPDDWMILSQDELNENANLLSPDNPVFAHTDKNVIYMMKQKVQSGELEFYMSTSMANLMFANNINVAKQIGRIPADADSANQLCAQLPALYSQEFGKAIQFQECTLKTVSGNTVMFIVGMGAIANTTSIQYFVQKSQNEMLIITGTFSNQNLSQEQEVLAQMVGSLKLN